MPEAEDVLVGAARHATSYAIDLWRRNRARDDAPDDAVTLRDTRERLELMAGALCGCECRIRTAAPPPRPTLLSRLWRPDFPRTHSTPIAGVDGVSLYLPPVLIGRGAASALDLFRLLAVEQGMRLRRGTARWFPWEAPVTAQDAYLVAEAAAADAEVAAACPGFRSAVGRVKQALLAERRARPPNAPELQQIEMLYRSVLASEYSGPVFGSPAESLEWALAIAARAPAVRPRGRLGGDLFLGEVLKADAAPGVERSAEAPAHDARAARSMRLDRRPRVRAARDDEDDEQPGLWMVQTSEPSEHVEDPMGLQRPVDKTPDADLQGTAESIADLEALRLVSTPGTPRELLLSEEDARTRGPGVVPTTPATSAGLRYPEWDYRIGAYRERAACVRVHTLAQGSAAWVDRTLERNRPTLLKVRRRFEALRANRAILRAQPDGDDVDIAAFVDAHGDRLAQVPRDDRLYVAHRPARRDFSLLVLVDASASTDAWVGADRRIVDIEKEALLVVAAALEALRVDFAVQAFSGRGPADVRVRNVKGFAAPFDRAAARRIAALEPDEYTRVGAALRHATAALMARPASRRLLLLLSDAKPNDCDHYEGRYGIEDARQALAEARLQGIAPFCVTVDRDATRHLPRLMGPGNYTVLRDASALTRALLDWLRAVAISLA